MYQNITQFIYNSLACATNLFLPEDNMSDYPQRCGSHFTLTIVKYCNLHARKILLLFSYNSIPLLFHKVKNCLRALYHRKDYANAYKYELM